MPKDFVLSCVRSGRRVDRAEFRQDVERSLCKLRELRTGAGDRVIVSVNDPLKCLTTLFAVWQMGCCAVMVNPAITDLERATVTKATGARLLVSDDAVQQMHGSGMRQFGPREAALILMTSGTTGVPKGVTHSFATLHARLAANLAEIGAASLDRTFCTLPLFFGHGLIGNALTALYAGKHLSLMPKMQLDEIGRFGETLDDLGITFFSSVPSFWRMVLMASPKPKHPPQRVHIGSAPLSKELWNKVSDWCGTTNVHNTYGMTETANWISGGALHDDRSADGYVGRPWGGQFKVWREGRLRDTGAGEIAVKTPGQMIGFWGQPDQTAAVLRGDYMMTGDLGVLEADQTLRLVGRTKNEINVAGIKVLAEEVDMLLERHPSVLEACSFGIPDPIAGERVGAVVRLSDDTVDAAALIAWCREQARPDAIPAKVEITKDIPKNDRGKISRRDIQRMMVAKWA
ncbi:class I adenylate-forming enzyme family protein [Yoonia sp.]|uniref:class I adenylate-forming enzyme family protein n=1 Tax=Yoonia sp. TaxID=2212373 RepID=UPI002FD9AF77